MATVKVAPSSSLSRPHDFPPLVFSHAGVIGRVRQVLDHAGYTKAGICQALDLDHPEEQLRAGDLVRMSRRCGGSPLEALIRLFLLGQPVAADVMRQALAPMTLEDWRSLGLLQADDTTATPLYQLLASDDLILALPIPSSARPPSRETMELRRELGSHRTRQFEELTIRRHSAATLDMTTGCGIHAFLAAAHSTEVLTVDGNPRATQLASFNAHLNGVHHIHCRPGGFAEVASGRKFDLVLCHPPLPIAPPPLIHSSAQSLPADGAHEEIVRKLPHLLAPDGYAQVLVHWAHLRGEAHQERLRRWVAGNGCDVWALQLSTQDPADYALDWLPEPPDSNLAPFERRFDAWMAYYAHEGIEAVSLGLITLRARHGKSHWFLCEQSPERLGSCGDSLLRGFANHTVLSGLAGEQALLEARPRLVPEARWETRSESGAGGWSAPSSQLRLSEGLARALQVNDGVVALLNECRGQRTFRELLCDFAASIEREPADVLSEGLQLARCLVEQGFVTVAV